MSQHPEKNKRDQGMILVRKTRGARRGEKIPETFHQLCTKELPLCLGFAGLRGVLRGAGVRAPVQLSADRDSRDGGGVDRAARGGDQGQQLTRLRDVGHAALRMRVQRRSDPRPRVPSVGQLFETCLGPCHSCLCH